MSNVYTEEEAKDKVCPQAIHMLGMQPMINCMGGGCMAWRNVVEYSNDKDKKLIAIVIGGYCGLGGEL
jgi:hypothetical protein